MNEHPDFDVIEPIGQGTRTVIYRAYQRSLNDREVAIKCLRDEFAEDPRRRDELLRLATFQASFTDDHVVRIYGIDRDHGWVVMELMEGSLADRIGSSGPVDSGFAREALRYCLRALRFLHRQGKLHGRIRPAKLLEKNGRIKLTGCEDLTIGSVLPANLVTSRYGAPELFDPSFGVPAQQLDFYLCGFTILELLMGANINILVPELAAGGDEQSAWMRWHSAKQSRPSSHDLVRNLPGDLAKTLDAMLNPMVSLRPQDSDTILAMLKGADRSLSPEEMRQIMAASTDTPQATSGPQSVKTKRETQPISRVQPKSNTPRPAPGTKKKNLDLASLPFIGNLDFSNTYVQMGLAAVLGIAAFAAMSIPALFSPKNAILTIEKMPAEAELRVQGNPANPISPDQPLRYRLPRGKQTIEVSLEGYVTHREELDVQSNLEPLSITLVPIESDVTFTSEHRDLKIYDGDKELAELSDGSGSIRLRPGTYDLVFRSSGFIEETRQINVDLSGDPLEEMIELEPVLRQVSLDSTPPGAEIFINGRAAEKNTPATVELRPGRHDFKVQLDGYIAPPAQRIEFRPEDTGDLDAIQFAFQRKVTLEVEPLDIIDDLILLINNQRLEPDQGAFSSVIPADQTLAVTAIAPGYMPYNNRKFGPDELVSLENRIRIELEEVERPLPVDPNLSENQPKDEPEVQTIPRLALQVGHSDTVSAVAITADGSRMVTGSYDSTAMLWDVASGRQLLTLDGHARHVLGVAISGDGKRVATGSADGTAVLWDVKSGQKIHRFTGHSASVESVALSPDGDRLLTVSRDRSAILWDTTTGQIAHTFSDHTDAVVAAAFSEDGSMVVTGSYDESAKLWDTRTGRMMRAFDRHVDRVTAVAIFTKNQNRIVATGTQDGVVVCWNMDDGLPLQTFAEHRGRVSGLAFDASGNVLASSSLDKTVILYDRRAEEVKQIINDHDDSVMGVTMDSAGQYLVTASSDNTCRVRDQNTGHAISTLGGNVVRVIDALVDGSSQTLIISTTDGRSTIWNLNSGDLQRQLGDPATATPSVALGRNGRDLATSAGNSEVKLWDVRTGNLQTSLQSPERVRCLGVSPQADRVIAGTLDGQVILWSLPMGTLQATLDAHRLIVWAVGFSDDGRMMASASNDRSIVVWDTNTQRTVSRLLGHDDAVFDVAFDPSSRFLVSASEDGTARIWEIQSGRETRSLQAHQGSVRAVAFGENYIATGGADKRIILWNADSGEKLRELSGHNAAITSLQFDPENKKIISAAADGTSRIWDVASGKELAVIVTTHQGTGWLVVTPDGEFDGNQTATQLVSYRTEEGEWFSDQDYRDRYHRPGLLNKIWHTDFSDLQDVPDEDGRDEDASDEDTPDDDLPHGEPSSEDS